MPAYMRRSSNNQAYCLVHISKWQTAESAEAFSGDQWRVMLCRSDMAHQPDSSSCASGLAPACNSSSTAAASFRHTCNDMYVTAMYGRRC